MSAAIDFDLFESKSGDKTGRCSIVSIYEDFGARELLLHLCHSLAWKFKDELEFKTDWWRFKYLADPEISREAAETVKQADLIFLSAQSPELPSGVRQCIDEWLPQRESPDGALVFVQSSPRPARALPLTAYLRLSAKRARLDYFRLDSWSSGDHLFKARMNELLNCNDHPMHWGINE